MNRVGEEKKFWVLTMSGPLVFPLWPGGDWATFGCHALTCSNEDIRIESAVHAAKPTQQMMIIEVVSY